MSDFVDTLVSGDFTAYGRIISKYLVRAGNLFLNYDPKTATMKLWANDGGGGETIFEVRNISYASVAQFAKDLDFKSDTDGSDPTGWNRCYPLPRLHHDGSEEAERLRMEFLRLEIPVKIVRDSKTCVLDKPVSGMVYRHELGIMWSVENLLGVVREIADQWKDVLYPDGKRLSDIKKVSV